jgi:subfamily B ATP-binding cassette protein MsbA
MKVLRSKAVVDPLLEVFGGLALAGIFAFAGWRAMNGQASV